MKVSRPRFVVPRKLGNGEIAYYFVVPTYYRKLGCPLQNEPLGKDFIEACGVDGRGGKAEALNRHFDEWNDARSGAPAAQKLIRYGSVDWLFREYKKDDAYIEKVSARSRIDYERIMLLVCDLPTKSGDRVGDRDIAAITPEGATKIYKTIIGTIEDDGPGKRLRQGEKVVKLCSKAWRVVHRLHPREFDRRVPDPWAGVTLKRRVKKTKAAVSREQVYQFAWGCIERGRPEPAAAAVICFEWLQRPENVLAGKIGWNDYRPKDKPHWIRINHHKTSKVVWHPLEELDDKGNVVAKFYEEAEAVLAHLPRLGVAMIMREVPPSRREPDRARIVKTFAAVGFQKIVRAMRDAIGLPAHFTLDACRHGGMTELEEAELTDGQGRALSAHTSKAYDGYAKRTEKRALAATRKRHAHVLANKPETEFRNDVRTNFEMEKRGSTK